MVFYFLKKMEKKYKRNVYEMFLKKCAAWSTELVLGQQEHLENPILKIKTQTKCWREKRKRNKK